MVSYLLEEAYRKRLLDIAIKKTGSKYSLAMAVGYWSVGSGKSVNEWYEGAAKIPHEKLLKLSEITGIPLEQIVRHTQAPSTRRTLIKS